MTTAQNGERRRSFLAGALTPLLLAFGLIATDQITKWVIAARLDRYEHVTVIQGFFELVHFRNRGAAFGFLSQVEGGWTHYLFSTIALVAVIVIAWLFRSTPDEDRLSRLGLLLVGSGAFGNLTDRTLHGEVIDFLLFSLGGYHWPAFNVADSCITVGVALLIYRTFVSGDPPEPSGPAAHQTKE